MVLDVPLVFHFVEQGRNENDFQFCVDVKIKPYSFNCTDLTTTQL